MKQTIDQLEGVISSFFIVIIQLTWSASEPTSNSVTNRSRYLTTSQPACDHRKFIRLFFFSKFCQSHCCGIIFLIPFREHLESYSIELIHLTNLNNNILLQHQVSKLIFPSLTPIAQAALAWGAKLHTYSFKRINYSSYWKHTYIEKSCSGRPCSFLQHLIPRRYYFTDLTCSTAGIY